MPELGNFRSLLLFGPLKSETISAKSGRTIRNLDSFLKTKIFVNFSSRKLSCLEKSDS